MEQGEKTSEQIGGARVTVVEVEQAVDDEVETIRQATVDYLQANPGATLKDLVRHLVETADTTDEYLSQAVAGLLTTGDVLMDSERRLRLA